LISSPEGISIVTADDTLTIRFTECVAVLIQPDRSVEIVGGDGSSIELELDDIPKGDEILADIREHVPPDRIVPMADSVRSWLAIEDVAGRKLKRRWVVSDELVALSEMLRPDEQVINLAEANRGLKAGLLAVTDQRLIFLYGGIGKKETLEFPVDTLSRIEGRSGSRPFSSSEISVNTSGERFLFKEIVPRERIAEIVEEVRARLTD
jgi:hypothetical protein